MAIDAKGLLPCPFCGGTAEVEWMGSRPMLFVVCKSCGNRSFAVVASHGGTEAEVIAAWNRRALSTVPADGLGKIEGQPIHALPMPPYDFQVPADGLVLPPPSEHEASVGWHYDFDWLDKVCAEAEASTGYSCTQEVAQYLIDRFAIALRPQVTEEEVEAGAKAMCVEGGFDPYEIMANDGQRWRYYVPGARACLLAAKGL